MGAPLTPGDLESVYDRIIPSWAVERLRRGQETPESVVRDIRSGCGGGCGQAPDGPYSDGKNAEWWALNYDHTGKGKIVNVRHEVRSPHSSTVLREGLLTWTAIRNEIVRRALLADRAERDAEPYEPGRFAAAGEQLSLPV